MKRVEKLLCVFLSVLMMASLSACNSGGTGGTTTKQTSGTKAQDGEETKTAETEGGETTQASVSEPFNFRYFVFSGSPDQGELDAQEYQVLADRIEADLGLDVTIEIFTTTFNDSPNMINTKLAAGELDAWHAGVPDYMDKDMAEPLDDLLNQYGQNILKLYEDDDWNAVKRNGTILCMPTFSSAPSYVVTWWRKDLSDKYGLEVPKSLEEFEEAMTTIMAGEPDMVGFSSMHTQWIFQSSLGGGVPKTVFTDDSNTQFKPFFVTSYSGMFYDDEPYYKEWLTMLQRWYKNGIINPEAFTMSPEKYEDLKNQNRLISASDG